MVTFKTKDKDKLRLVSQQSIDLPENMKADSCIIQKVASVLSTHEQIYDSWEKNEIVFAQAVLLINVAVLCFLVIWAWKSMQRPNEQ